MIVELCRIALCVAFGEMLSRFSPLPLPGPVFGLVILFVWLCYMGRIPALLDSITDRMLELFGLFFVPAGVGIIVYKDGILSEFLAISAAISIGTAITIIMSGFIAAQAAKWDDQTGTIK